MQITLSLSHINQKLNRAAKLFVLLLTVKPSSFIVFVHQYNNLVTQKMIASIKLNYWKSEHGVRKEKEKEREGSRNEFFYPGDFSFYKICLWTNKIWFDLHFTNVSITACEGERQNGMICVVLVS